MVERDTELRQTPPAGGYRILLVDDEEEFLEAAGRALRRRGYIVFTAGGVDEARELFAALCADGYDDGCSAVIA